MALKIKFGRPQGRGMIRSKILSISRSILSGIFLTLAILLVLLSASEMLVYFIDAVVEKNDIYLDWGRAPMIIFLSSIPFFLIFILLNLDRFKFTALLLKKFRTSKPPEKIETIDLD